MLNGNIMGDFKIYYLNYNGKNFKFLFIYFYREGIGGRKRGRETSMPERNINRLPLLGALGTKSRRAPRLGIEPVTLCFAGWCAAHGVTLVGAIVEKLLIKNSPVKITYSVRVWTSALWALGKDSWFLTRAGCSEPLGLQWKSEALWLWFCYCSSERGCTQHYQTAFSADQISCIT